MLAAERLQRDPESLNGVPRLPACNACRSGACSATPERCRPTTMRTAAMLELLLRDATVCWAGPARLVAERFSVPPAAGLLQCDESTALIQQVLLCLPLGRCSAPPIQASVLPVVVILACR